MRMFRLWTQGAVADSIAGSTADRQDWADVARGMGIILVVVGHVARGLLRAGLEVPQPFHDHLDRVLYSFHMPLFFLLSGWFVTGSLRRRGPWSFIASRIDTLVWPYVLWSLLQGSIEVGLNRWTNGAVTWFQVASLAWAPRGQFWFLYVLFLCQAIVAGAWWIAKGRGLLVVLAVALGLYALTHFVQFRFVPFLVFAHLPWFVAGMVLGSRVRLAQRVSPLASITAWIACGATYAVALTSGADPSRPGWAGLIVGSVGIAAILATSCSLSERFRRPLATLGSLSLGVYLMHILAGAGVRILLERVFSFDNYWLHLGIGTAVGVMIPAILTRLAENHSCGFLFRLPVSSFVIQTLRTRKVP